MTKPTGPQAPLAAQGGGAGPTDCDAHKLLLILGHRDKDGGEVQHCFKAWAKAIREANGSPLQYSCLENPMDGGAW